MNSEMTELGAAVISSIKRAIYHDKECRNALKSAAIRLIAWLDDGTNNAANVEQPATESEGSASAEARIPAQPTPVERPSAAPETSTRQTEVLKLRLGDEEAMVRAGVGAEPNKQVPLAPVGANPDVVAEPREGPDEVRVSAD